MLSTPAGQTDSEVLWLHAMRDDTDTDLSGTNKNVGVLHAQTGERGIVLEDALNRGEKVERIIVALVGNWQNSYLQKQTADVPTLVVNVATDGHPTATLNALQRLYKAALAGGCPRVPTEARLPRHLPLSLASRISKRHIT